MRRGSGPGIEGSTALSSFIRTQLMLAVAPPRGAPGGIGTLQPNRRGDCCLFAPGRPGRDHSAAGPFTAHCSSVVLQHAPACETEGRSRVIAALVMRTSALDPRRGSGQPLLNPVGGWSRSATEMAAPGEGTLGAAAHAWRGRPRSRGEAGLTPTASLSATGASQTVRGLRIVMSWSLEDDDEGPRHHDGSSPDGYAGGAAR
jgi:hypothetical protein